MLPNVATILAISRKTTHPLWTEKAVLSCKNQYYPGEHKVYEIQNPDRVFTIGKCWNDGVKGAERAEWCLFVGDDDFISKEYLLSLTLFGEEMYAKDSRNVGVGSYLILFEDDENGLRYEARNLIPTGLWRRDYLLKHPFKEHLTKFVDIDFMEAARKGGYIQVVANWQYGYHYRSHTGQISNKKMLTSSQRSMVEPARPQNILDLIKGIKNNGRDTELRTIQQGTSE